MTEFLATVTGEQAHEGRTAAIVLVWLAVGSIVLVALRPGGRRAARQVFAVAALAFREGLRMKVLWTVSLLTLLVGGLAFFSDADGTHVGRATVVMNYCLSAGEFLGAMLIVLLSALSLANEIESRVMHTFGTKPVPRWAILLGKALGFWALDALFLIGVTLFAAVLVRAVPMRAEARSSGRLASTGTWTDLRRNLLSTREYISASGDYAGVPTMRMVRPGASRTWLFRVDPTMARSEALAIRFQLSSTMTFASRIENTRIRVAYQDDAQAILDRTESVPQDRPFDVFLPPQDLTKTGVLAVTVFATNEGRAPPSIVGAIRIGVAADTFGSNLLKSLLLMALQGWVLALITTSWSGVLSFPVTVALGVLLVLGGEMSRSAMDLLQVGAERAQTLGLDGRGIDLRKQLTEQLRMILGLMPDFRAAGGPTAFLDGQIVSVWAVAQAVLSMGIARAIGWALPGVILFHQREVGR